MAFESPFAACQQEYRPFVVAEPYDGNTERLQYPVNAHFAYGPSSTIVSTMERFLSEPEPHFHVRSLSGIDEQRTQPFPDLPYHVAQRLPSPSNSGHDSSYASSGWSDCQESPYSPLLQGSNSYPPDHSFNDGVAYAYGGHPPLERHDSHSFGGCVTMQDVQKCADAVPEITFDDAFVGFSAYGTFAQEGYQPIQNGEDDASHDRHGESCGDHHHHPHAQSTLQRDTESPVIRRRRTQSRSTLPPVLAGRVSKRPHVARRESHNAPNAEDDASGSAVNRAFPCPLAIYGCNSSFGSKNEWKRHVNTQHMRLGYWRCDQCSSGNSDRKPNDFNRKDLFVQHVRRMHPMEITRSSSSKRSGSKSPRGNTEEYALQDAATRCYKALRSPPEESGCLFCDQTFRGRNTWDERMEHVGRHMEVTKKDNEDPVSPGEWRVDKLAQEWMLNEQIVVQHGKRLILATL